MNAWTARYVGLPFADTGRDIGGAGVDCYGLLRAVLMNEKGIALPEHGEISAGELIAAAREMESTAGGFPWRPVRDPQAFDAVLMRAADGRRANTHCGVMADAATLLHTTAATGSVLVGLNHHSVRGRIAGVFRHAALQ